VQHFQTDWAAWPPLKEHTQFDALIDKWNHQPVVRVLRHVHQDRELVPSIGDATQSAHCNVEVVNRAILRNDEGVTEAVHQPHRKRFREDLRPSSKHCLPIESSLID